LIALQKDKFVSVHKCRDRNTQELVDRIYALLGADESRDGFCLKNLQTDCSLPAKRDFVRLYINFAVLVSSEHWTSSRWPRYPSKHVWRVYHHGARAPIHQMRLIESPLLNTAPAVNHFRVIQCSSAKSATTLSPSSLRTRSEYSTTFRPVDRIHIRLQFRQIYTDQNREFDSKRVLAWLDNILEHSHMVSPMSDHDLPDCYWRLSV
jgi:hypothetical protein